MKALKTFGECLGELMRSHALTAAGLAAQLGLSNATAVTRLVSGHATAPRMEEIIDRLSQGTVFSDSEIELLRQAMLVSLLGKSAYAVQRSIHQLAFEDVSTISCDIHLESGMPLERYLARLADGGKLSILCIDCCDPGIFAGIRPLFKQVNNDIQISHYVSLNRDTRSYARIMRAVGTLFFDQRYRLYTTNVSTHGTDSFFFLPYALLLHTDQSESMLWLSSDRTAHTISLSHHLALNVKADEIIRHLSPVPLSIVNENPGILNLRDDLFLRYQREKNRAILQLRPDPSFLLMPPLVLQSVLPAESVSMKRQIVAILSARSAQLQKKSRPHYFLLSFQQTRRFFQTGRQHDHLCDAPPFSAKQREAILDYMLSLFQSSEHLHFRFLEPENNLHHFQFTWYESLGVRVSEIGRTYSPFSLCRELLITDVFFCDHFRNYYENILFPGHTYSDEKSLAMLSALREEIC